MPHAVFPFCIWEFGVSISVTFTAGSEIMFNMTEAKPFQTADTRLRAINHILVRTSQLSLMRSLEFLELEGV